MFCGAVVCVLGWLVVDLLGVYVLGLVGFSCGFSMLFMVRLIGGLLIVDCILLLRFGLLFAAYLRWLQLVVLFYFTGLSSILYWLLVGELFAVFFVIYCVNCWLMFTVLL